MPFSSGTFSRVHDWTSDRDAGIKISASRTDAEFDGIATALTSTMLKDGSQTLTAMIPFTLGLSVPTDKKLQLRDSAIFLNSSADGQADLVADSVIQVTAPTVNIEASTAITLESDAITLGENGDTDIVLTFNANSADGVITWKEDEDYFLLSDDILMNSTEKIQFGDTASFIQQSSDGVLRIDGEATIDLNASTAVLVSHDLKLDSDGAILGFGADNDVTLTHVHDTGLLLNTNLNVTRSDNGDNLTLISTDADAGGGPALSFYRNSSSPADDDTMCTIRFEGNNDNSQLVIYGKIRADIADASDGTEDGTIHIFNMMAGTERAMLSIKPDEVVFNEESQDVDFRVESDNETHALFIQGSDGAISMGTSTPNNFSGFKCLTLGGASATTGSLVDLEDSSGNIDGRVSGESGNLLLGADPGSATTSSKITLQVDGSEKARIGNTGLFEILADTNGLLGDFNNADSSSPVGVRINFTGADPNNVDNYFLAGEASSNNRFKIYSAGTIKNSTGSYTSFSDERLKSDIVDAKSQWNDIKALKFKNFTKFDNPDLKQLGLIAQDVEKTSANLVFETPPEIGEIKHNSVFGTLYEDGDTIPEGKKVGDVKEVKSQVKNVKDSILYMKAVKALQEAMTRIETLEAKVKALEEA
jgi:hypothetical protein